MRILLVEDDDIIREYVNDVLSEKGHQVFVAGTVSAALVLLRNEPAADLLVTDFSLEDKLDGVDVADQFKAIHPSAHVLLVSGDPETARKKLDQRGAKFGVFLAKPFVREALLEAIDTATGLTP